MDTLPTELLRIICKHLPSRDVTSFRLTNRRFAAIGAKYLLTEIYLLFEEESIRPLEAVSQHPIIGRTLKRLRVRFDEVELVQGWHAYQSKLNWQAMATATLSGGRDVSRTIARLPNLELIRVYAGPRIPYGHRIDRWFEVSKFSSHGSKLLQRIELRLGGRIQM